jgi:glycosyltransferase involved in cell wall biosynthesis
MAKRGALVVANAPVGQVSTPHTQIASAQTGSRAASLIRDLFRSVLDGEFDLRIDSAPAFRPFSRARKRVVIVHDLNFLEPRVHSISWKQKIYRRLLHRVSVARADLIVVNSESTRREVERFLPEFEGRLQVQPLPVDEMFRGAPPSTRRAERDGNAPISLLSFGHAKNKGVDCLMMTMRAFPQLELTVVCTRAEWNAFWADIASELGVTDRVTVVESPDDGQLIDLYRKASVFCMVSSYEGYGMPVTEALALGVPVVISDLDVLRSSSRGVGVAVDRSDPSDIWRGVQEALRGAGGELEIVRSELRGEGWDTWCAQFLEVVADDQP